MADRKSDLLLFCLLQIDGFCLGAVAFLVCRLKMACALFKWVLLSLPVLIAAAAFLAFLFTVSYRRIRKILLKRGIFYAALDIGIIIALFLAGVIIATLYIHSIKTYGGGLYYQTGGPVQEYKKFLWPLFPYGIFFGSMMALSYGILRLGMGRLISLICAAFFMTSSNHLHFLSVYIFHDYIKGIFILAGILVMGIAVALPWRRMRLYILSAIMGIVIGIGVKFRQDIMIMTVPYAAVLLLFLPIPIRSHVIQRLICGIVFVATIFLCFICIHTTYAEVASFAPHRILGGLMAPIDGRVGVMGSSYDWGYLFKDEFICSSIYAQARARQGSGDFNFTVNEYNRLGYEYIYRIITNFPADFLARTYASILQVLELPFLYREPPLGVHTEMIKKFYDVRAKIIGLLSGSGLLLVLVTLFIISARNLRVAVFCLLFLVFFTGYPVLQFQGRHYFHLEFISWWAAGFCLERLVSSVRKRSLSIGHLFVKFSKQGLKQAIAFIVIACGVFIICLFVLRIWQSQHVAGIFTKYVDAEVQQLPLIKRHIQNGRTIFISPELLPKMSKNDINVDFVRAEFTSGPNNYSTIWPLIRYGYIASNRYDFSRVMPINTQGQEVVQLFFPIISHTMIIPSHDKIRFLGGTYFYGIEMPDEQAACLQAIYRVKDIDRLPILLTAVVRPRLGKRSLWHRLLEWETPRALTIPSNLSNNDINLIKELTISTISGDDVYFKADIVDYRTHQWRIKGYATPHGDLFVNPRIDKQFSSVSYSTGMEVMIGKVDTDLLITNSKALKKGQYFIAEGNLLVGGVTFALIREGKNAGFLQITRRGPFEIIMQVPEDGYYSLGIANNVDMYTSLENNLVIRKMGWVSP